MRVAYFDCFAGASGDMILGALLDAGLQLDALREALASLPLNDWELKAERVVTGGLSATRASVTTDDEAHARAYTELDSILSASQLAPDTKDSAKRILRRLAEVESRLHGASLEHTYLHELGGVDTIIDVVGAVVGLQLLGVDEVFVSALPTGSGTVNTRHGILPLPAPAMVELARGAPIRSLDIQAELVTPTGAAILTTLARGYSTHPLMTLSRVGYGAGTRELPIPNILRVLIGDPWGTKGDTVETLVWLETNIDDMNPQLYDYAMTKLFEAGALDVWLTPIQMKKNRSGTMLSALCRLEAEDGVSKVFFEETTILGLRRREVQRRALAREIVSVATSYGPVRIKVAFLNHQPIRAQPEYEDCRKLAESNRVPLLDVFRAAEASARAAILWR